MALLEDKDERFKNLFGKTAVFILFAALGIGLTFLWIEVKRGAFTAMSPIYFVADSGLDLNEGMPVKFSGFKIGKLKTMSLDERGHVQVGVSIESKYLDLIRQDAVVTLKKEGVIGDGVLEISKGAEEKPALVPGSTVGFQRASGLEQAVIDVKNRITPILDDISQLLHDPQGDVRQTLSNLREFSADLRKTIEKLDHVLGSVDQNLNQEVVPLMRSLRTTAANAETIAGRLDKQLPELLEKADSSMESMRVTSESIRDAVKQSAPQLPEIVGEANDALGKTSRLVDDTQSVVDSLSSSWPFKGSVPEPETGPVRMDSHD